MKQMIALALGAALVATTVEAQTPSPPAGVAPVNPPATRVVRKPTKVKKNPRYSSGVPVVAGGPNGVRINSSGEVLYDEP